MSILLNFWKLSFEKSFLNSVHAFKFQLSRKALPLNCF